ncbi:hypothetical protein [Aurantiacibacter spongiae]|uniref:TonB C-terminal domain-containing protein n=1 Tax=Aurantiacibacter spongiae TaxID=2488860 RepID=A0A3N5CRW3_9SPHN|nr:hypothetical protein [Aurantiacibacter spongiae]RPF71337.1 hypothetical protein EG799_06725 [Aurantiacibacter spongiae]
MGRFTVAAAIAAIASPVTSGASAFAQTGDAPTAQLDGRTREAIAEGRLYLPDGVWRLTRSEDGCNIQRDFIRDDARVTLAMRQQPAGPTEFSLIGAGFEIGDDLEAGFVPGTGLTPFTYLRRASIGDRHGVIYTGAMFGDGQAISQTGAANMRYYVAQAKRTEPVVLSTGPLGQALAALVDCQGQILESLGVDLAVQRTLSQNVELTNVGALIDAFENEYRGRLLRQSGRGAITVFYVVDADGKMTHCRSTDRLMSAELRQLVCDTMTEVAQFTPARTAQGEAVTGYMTQSINFTFSLWPGANGQRRR